MIDVDIEQQLGAFRLDVKFSAEAPIVGLFGRSGSGKTSVINAIAGIATPRRGSIRINDVVLFDTARRIDMPPEERRVGYVFQDALLFPHMDVESNLLYGQRLRPPKDRFIEEARVVELLGLGALLHRKPKALSGGEKQRVAIGRALLAQPRILLMDEPLASLDVPRKTEILDYVERLRDELSIPIVYVSHSVTEITRLADTVVVLADGKCLAVGAVDDVMGRLDLNPDAGRYEAGSVLDTRVAAHDSEGSADDARIRRRRPHRPASRSARSANACAPGFARATCRFRFESRLKSVYSTCFRPAVTAIDEESGSDRRSATRGRRCRRSSRALRAGRSGSWEFAPGRKLYALVKAVSFDQRSVGYA